MSPRNLCSVFLHINVRREALPEIWFHLPNNLGIMRRVVGDPPAPLQPLAVHAPCLLSECHSRRTDALLSPMTPSPLVSGHFGREPFIPGLLLRGPPPLADDKLVIDARVWDHRTSPPCICAGRAALRGNPSDVLESPQPFVAWGQSD